MYQTNRLIIRPLQIDDYEAWYQAYARRLPSQNPFDEGLLDMSMCDLAWFASLVSHHQKLIESDKQVILAIFDQKTGVHIGMIDIVTLSRANFQWCELGYSIHNHYWRKGYAYESLKALLNYVRNELGFHRIEAHVSLGNQASQKLLEKLGFVREGIREKFIYEHNQWTDKIVYALNLYNHQP